jgi:hypothetical protein
MAQQGASSRQIVSAYRNLYKAGLKAVRHAQPARFTLRRILTRAFREEPASSFDEHRVRNTIAFLGDAAKYTGVEHKVVKNVLMIRYWRDRESFPTSLYVYSALLGSVRLTLAQYQGPDSACC